MNTNPVIPCNGIWYAFSLPDTQPNPDQMIDIYPVAAWASNGTAAAPMICVDSGIGIKAYNYSVVHFAKEPSSNTRLKFSVIRNAAGYGAGQTFPKYRTGLPL